MGIGEVEIGTPATDFDDDKGLDVGFQQSQYEAITAPPWLTSPTKSSSTKRHTEERTGPVWSMSSLKNGRVVFCLSASTRRLSPGQLPLHA